MTDGLTREIRSIRDNLAEIPSGERSRHRELVARNIDFLIEVLSAEQYAHGRTRPDACPHALVNPTARRREKKAGVFPCSYREVCRSRDEGPRCPCEDPLQQSDDPMDAAAAVILGSDDRAGSFRYFDREWRAVVGELRSRWGQWEDIARLSYGGLKNAIDQATARRGVADHRVRRLKSALEYIGSHRYTEGITLRNLPAVPYQQLADFLGGCPGLDERDAWWLILTALDKPVWPADPAIDTLLVDFGLLDIADLRDDHHRLDAIEDLLTDRQIPTLHRAMAGHALKARASYCGEDCEVRKFSLLYRSGRQADVSEGPNVVDLFSGAGGLSSGFVREGFRIALAIDSDEHATDTYRFNHPEIPHERVQCTDIESILSDNPDEMLQNDVEIVIGGPPCQSLSQAGYRARLANDDDYSILNDPRTHLYQSYVRIVERLDPSVILMENVEGIINEIGDSDIRVLDQIINALEARGYVCRAKLLDCSRYGIPQQRERVFLVGLKPELAPTREVVDGIFEMIEAGESDRTYTLQQGLAGLPRLRRGEGGNALPCRNPGRLGEYLSRNDLRGRTQLTFNHQARHHPKEKDRELFDSVMEPGDTGWAVKFEKGRDDLIEYDVGTADNPRFIDKYRMIHWDEPAPTVVAHLAKDANNFIIPDYFRYARPDDGRADPRRNRGVTPREAARLQSFPDDYIFLGPYTSQFRQIGNAVPPVLGRQFARIFRKVLSLDRSESETMDALRCSTEPVAGD